VAGAPVGVIACDAVKPVDVGTVACRARATGGPVVVATKHHALGGLGSAVIAAGSTRRWANSTSIGSS
jgi:transketolase C-terminal domain/subunit